ncbi:MAG: putative sulfate/molybdate transporter [Desulfocapsaceae bacterium]|nr:putative sulfate/molybdate transporter [Desulfocapsaceae bacterium]
MAKQFIFNRLEFSGSLGDLGTILPLALGMVLVNGMDPKGVFFCFGLYYIFSGLYFRVTSPVEPMKVIAAYALASGITATQIQASSLLIALVLFALGGSGIISSLKNRMPIAVVRGVQLSTGTLLLMKGLQLMLGTSPIQLVHELAEPYLSIQSIGPLPIGIVLGAILSALTLYLYDNSRIPAAVSIVTIGLIVGVIFQHNVVADSLNFQPSLPNFLPYGLPTATDFSFALLVLVLPQIPMTIGNAIIANADLSASYFPETGKKVTGRSLCLSMAFANFATFFLGGIPMCHGAGGLASRYRFGARTGGSNLIIGTIFIILVLVFGQNIQAVLHFIPLSVLGVLLVFAGCQLSLTILDVKTRQDMFVVLIILGLTLALNLAAGFIVGIILALILRSPRLSI